MTTPQPIEPRRDEVNNDSEGFRAGFLLGLERGTAAGYEKGYADAEVTLQEVVGGFLQANPPAGVIRAMEARAARDAARDKPLDPRTPQQVQRDAYDSWDLDPPRALAQEARRHDDGRYIADVAVDDFSNDDAWGA
jgi:hypothetical protein